MFLTKELERIRGNIANQLNQELSTLAPAEQALLLNAAKRQEKSYLLALTLCCIGSHYLYMNDIKTQLIFWLTLGGFGIWWIIELAYLKQRIEIINCRIRLEFARKFAPRLMANSVDSSTHTVVLENFVPPTR